MFWYFRSLEFFKATVILQDLTIIARSELQTRPSHPIEVFGPRHVVLPLRPVHGLYWGSANLCMSMEGITHTRWHSRWSIGLWRVPRLPKRIDVLIILIVIGEDYGLRILGMNKNIHNQHRSNFATYHFFSNIPALEMNNEYW